jgi:hypothetical protein
MGTVQSKDDTQPKNKISSRGEQGPKGEQGPRGEQGPKGDKGPKGDPGVIDTSKTLWCADGFLCKSPDNARSIEWGVHTLNMDTDKVIRHYNKGTVDHRDMGFATANVYATNSVVIGEGRASCLHLGSHKICSDGGTLLTIKGQGGNAVNFDIYTDGRHSSFRTFNTNDDGSLRERWQGYA